MSTSSGIRADNLRIWEQVREVPPEAKKEIGGGRLKGMTDINPVWRIKKLTEIYGPVGEGWYTDEITERTIQCGDEIVALVTLKLYTKTAEGWGKPIFGSGGSMLYAKESKGMFASDEAFKMAYTDALSVACKALGIAADVYFSKDRTKYDVKTDSPNPDPKPEPRVNQKQLDMIAQMCTGPDGQKDLVRSEILRNEYTKLGAKNAKDIKAKDFDAIKAILMKPL